MRHEKTFPKKEGLIMQFLHRAWCEGWLDEYSDDHFVIRALENRIDTFTAFNQFSGNTVNSSGIIHSFNDFFDEGKCETFCMNLSQRLQYMSSVFGDKAIQDFVQNQLAAGKGKYNEDSFFEALSEISVLSAIGTTLNWERALYEPHVGESNKNPEASFLCNRMDIKDSKQESFSVNVEVKTPRFEEIIKNQPVFIPGKLLSSEGREKLAAFCSENEITYLAPRVLKLRDYINSAASKFKVASKETFNILFINWSFRDFPDSGFYEAWSLLTNNENGILKHAESAKEIGVNPDALSKISAIVVYTEGLEGLLFGDFKYIWQQNIHSDPHFCACVINRDDEELYNNNCDILLQAIGMRPSGDCPYVGLYSAYRPHRCVGKLAEIVNHYAVKYYEN